MKYAMFVIAVVIFLGLWLCADSSVQIQPWGKPIAPEHREFFAEHAPWKADGIYVLRVTFRGSKNDAKDWLVRDPDAAVYASRNAGDGDYTVYVYTNNRPQPNGEEDRRLFIYNKD